MTKIQSSVINNNLLNFFIKYKNIFIFLVTFVFIFIIYTPSLSNEYVFDDVLFASRNDLRKIENIEYIFTKQLIPSMPEMSVWRPMATLSFVIDYFLFGDNPFISRVINFLLYNIVVMLIVLVLRLKYSYKISTFSALIFLVFPIHTEVVASIKSRDEILSAIFILSSLYIAYKYIINKRIIYLILSSIFFTFALLSKEHSVVGLLLIPLYLYFINPKKSKEILVLSVFLFVSIVLVFYFRIVILNIYIPNASNIDPINNPLLGEGQITRFITLFKLNYLYIQKIIFPLDLSATYSINHLLPVKGGIDYIFVLFGLFPYLLLIYFFILKKYNFIFIGLLIYEISIFSVLGFPIIAFNIFAERWAFLPSLGIALMIGYTLRIMSSKSKLIGVLAFLCIIFIYSFTTYNRSKIWANNKIFFEQMIIDAPDSSWAYMQYATSGLNNLDLTKAEYGVKKSLEITPDYYAALSLRGSILLAKGDILTAIKVLEKAYKINSDYEPIMIQLAVAYNELHDDKKAIYYFEKSYKSNKISKGSVVLTRYIESLNRLGQYKEAQNVQLQYGNLNSN